MFFSSPSNTVDGHICLLEKLACVIFLTPQPEDVSSVPQKILAKRSMRTLPLPNLNDWLQGSDVATYPYRKTYLEASHDPFVVLHSSGSTGIPKVLVLAHGTMTPVDSYQMIPSLGGSPWQSCYWRGKRVFTSFPWFHAAGIMFLLPTAIFNEFIPVIVPSVPKINAEIANSVHLYGNVEASLFPPSILVDISTNPEYLENLRSLEFVSYVGGPLSYSTGQLISAKTHLNSGFGSTETGYLPTEITAPEDWQYVKFSSQLGHQFHDFGDNLFELIITRDKALEPFQGIFFTFPDLQEYSMKDLYVSHPAKKGLWRHAGRTDDVIVFLDARKLNPASMEAAIGSHPSIGVAIICGHARPQPAVLIEPLRPVATRDERECFLSEIWLTLEQVVLDGPASGKIVKDLIILTTPEKPILRAGGKGTILRKRSVDIYQAELDHAYAALLKTS